MLALARAKADALRARLTAADNTSTLARGGPPLPLLLLTADQVVVHKDRIREKPADVAEARRFVRSYGGSSARTVGALAVTNLATGAAFAALDLAEVFFRPIPEEVVEQLVADGDCLRCAGGLMVEHPLVAPYVERIQGGMDSVMGLGMDVATRLLLQAAGEA